MRVFGDIVPGVKYHDRPGAYGIVKNSSGLYAILKTPNGYFLPGGGLEPGETHQEALRREVIEEIGLSCDVLNLIGVAAQLLCTEGVYIKKIGNFYHAKLGKPVPGRKNMDHELHWVPKEEAETLLTQEYQVYMIGQA